MDFVEGGVRPHVERRLLALLLTLLTCLFAAGDAADTMPLSQVHKGMHGYGVTVFEGNRLEKFDVEILGVLHNIGPGQNLILAKVDSPVIQRAGVIAGMSGSPIYIDGKVIGALAWSWQFEKEPVAGITPIEEMLKIADLGASTSSAVIAATPRISAGEFVTAIANHKETEVFDKLESGFASASPARTTIAVMPSLASSFKFANTGAIVGSFRQDRSTGIMGMVGDKADMIPIDLTVEGSGPVKAYHVNIIRHSMLSPLILAMAADSVVANAQRAAGERTVVMDSEIKLKGFDESIRLREGWAGAQARQAIPAYLALVAGYVMSNEFRVADIESIKIHLRHDDDLKIAKLLEASIEPPANGRITPGDTVKVRTVLKPFRGEPFVESFDLKIPDNQTPGSAYLLVGSGSLANQIDFSLVPPDPRTLEQVIAVLERLRPSTDLTVGLYSSAEGAVTAGVYLPNLPPSMHAVVSADSSNGAQASVKYHAAQHLARPLGYIVDGAVKIDLDIKPNISCRVPR